MPFTLENLSGYDTGDLRAFLAAGFRALGEPRRTIHVVVTAAPGRSRGCAQIGGDRLSLAIAAPWRFSTRRLARLFTHEHAHLMGKEHGTMPKALLYSEGPVPGWAEGMRIRYRRRAPPQLRELRRRRITRV